jgi:hypothetical protein
MLDSILFKFQVLSSICNIYYIVLFCFRLRGTTKELFMVDDVGATLANCEVFMHWHA